ncbi:MAG: lysoplasmalogenase [Flavobacteriales bacterium]|nr:lysoplasmalogenase [Flavobacteriales bacterium]
MRPGFAFVYALLLAATIITAIEPSLLEFHAWVKPLLMGSLIIYVVVQGKRPFPKGLLLLALVASLAGDVLLLPQIGPHGFLAGLFAFLCAHAIYIYLFTSVPQKVLEVSFIRKNPWVIFLSILFGLWMFYRLKPGAGDLLWAIVLYMLVILTMLVTALDRKGKVSHRSYVLVSMGALLFVISDSVLAWNRFIEPLSQAPIWILGTYGLAQLAIAQGVVLQSE